MVTNLQSDGDVVYVPVPKQYLQVVINALSKAMSGAQVLPEPTEVPWPAEDLGGPYFDIDWSSPQNMRRLLRELRGEGAFKALELTAKHPGEIVSMQDIVDAS